MVFMSTSDIKRKVNHFFIQSMHQMYIYVFLLILTAITGDYQYYSHVTDTQRLQKQDHTFRLHEREDLNHRLSD